MARFSKMTSLAISGATAACFTLGAMPSTAHADTVSNTTAPSSHVLTVSDQKALNLVNEIYTKYLVQNASGNWVLNSHVSHPDISTDDLVSIANSSNTFAAATKSVTAHKPAGVATPLYSVGSSGYWKCILDKSGYGSLYSAIAGAAGGWSAISALGGTRFLVSSIIKFLGASAIKGGAAGLALSLGASAGWCALPWA